MAIDTTIRRDADGRVALTVEQAAALARWLANPRIPAGLDVAAIIGASGGETVTLLARWVLQWAPVVRAAIEQERAQRVYSTDRTARTAESYAAAQDSVYATEAAVRAARGEGEATS